MITRILRSVATFAAIIALFGASHADACQTISVTNNTGVAVQLKMYDNTGATVVNVTIATTGGSFIVPSTVVVGFISAAGTQVPGGNPCATSCFVMPLPNGTAGPCVSACGNGCSLTLNLCNGPCTP